MFAVMKTGGKQYKVQPGDTLRVEKLAADAGETVQFNEILMLGGDSTVVGAPLVAGAAVQAEVIDQIKGDKVIHFVKRRRKHSSQRTKGHRQHLTLLRVTEILSDGGDKTGVKAAIGAGAAGLPGTGTDRYAENRDDQSEMIAQVRNDEAKAMSAGDDLTAITGVGPAAAAKLNEAGITTYAELAAVDPETFEGTKVKPEWVEQAKTLA
ncbi:50S ribosomal protein L21 [Salipiger mucosus]|uniref:Large ribosomal subunit protein bL21 n=1 Tax=Salipiger mucosus DSM 16094 TaxID=1123237 RepID=S9QFL3_9RHOB|nr:50S ribosomal protein L21 [Salipiger mucosus]EPX78408.1 LSU ribosomal protein L21p [Salipiger mucosus DSM 16094]